MSIIRCRTVLAILLITSMMGGCGGTAQNHTEVSSEVQLSSEADTTESSVPETVSSKGVCVSETGKGRKVRLDYSNYTARGGSTAEPKRKSKAWIENLEDGDYKAIYPFVGSIQYEKRDDGYTAINDYRFGIVDDTGCIIADPTYNSVTLASRYNMEKRTVEQYPFWVLTRTTIDPDRNDEDDLFSDGYYSATVSAVATLDGSAVTACKYTVVIPGDFGVFLATDLGSKEFMILDRSGQVILTERNVDFMDRVTEYTWWGIGYSEGLFTIGLSDGYYYMDLEGNLVMGPYGYAEAFSHGRAATQNEYYNTCQLIDIDGNVIIPEGLYDSIGTYDSHGLTVASRYEADTEETREYVIDIDGNVILETVNDYPEICGDLIIINHWDENGTITKTVYDLQGKELDMEGKLDSYDNEINSNGWFSHETEGEKRLFNISSGLSIDLPDSVESIYGTPILRSDEYEPDAEFITVIEVGGSEDDASWSTDVYSADGEKVIEDCSFAYVWHDETTGNSWLSETLSDTRSRWYAPDGRTYVLDAAFSAVYGDQLLSVSDSECRYLDTDGNVWFRYPLVNSCGD